MKRMLTLCIVLIGFLTLPAVALAETPSNKMSFFYTDAMDKVLAPYEPIELTVGLLRDEGRLFFERPEGKVFFWVTRPGEDEPLPVLELIDRSVPSDLPIHPLADNPAIMIADGGAFERQRSFKVRITAPGNYECKATVLAPHELPFMADDVSFYNDQLFRFADDNAPMITIGATPAHDVGFLLLSPSIGGIELPSTTVRPPRNQKVDAISVPVHEDGKTQTTLTVRLYRTNGQPVGAGVPLEVSTNGQKIALSGKRVESDDFGLCRLMIHGKVGEGDYLSISLNKNDEPVLVPLAAYTYHPQLVRLKIGSQTMDVDGRDVMLDAPAVIKEGRTYVPYRAIGEILGAEIEYNQVIRTITTTYEDKTITMTLGYDHYAVDNEIFQMDAMPYITKSNRTMVPLRFIADATGYDVQAIADERGAMTQVIFSKAV